MSVAGEVDNALLNALRREGLDTLERAFAYRGGEDLSKANLGHRRRTRLKLADENGRIHELYLKRYGRESLMGRLRRWVTYGRRCSPANVEFENIRAIRQFATWTMEAVMFGEEHGLLGPKRSYIVVTAVPGEALERCF
ncbi:MAG: hypothetical protein KAU28_05770, partial [Phycisphaerae bacterium]|nr:hypothetical protein [Phycisphaerae bacterium]